MRVILLDVTTGEERQYPHDGLTIWSWTDGNWSCDCNRVIAWHPIEWTSNTGYCEGGKRYLVIAASEGDFDELNADYPQALRDQYRDQFRRIDA